MDQSSRPETILFDLDDTIMVYTGGTQELWLELCYRFTAGIDQIDGQSLYDAIMEYSHWYWADNDRHRVGRLDLDKSRRDIVKHVFSTLGLGREQMAVDLADTYNRERNAMATLFDGARETLTYLKDKGYKLGLITNGASDPQRAKISKFDLAQYFDIITIEGEFGQGKPDLEVFRHTLGSLGSRPENAWMIGDDLSRDIYGAHNAGITSVWVDWQRQGLPEDTTVKPSRIITLISDLMYNEIL